AILFLNRRGFSSFVMCNKCGYVAKCEDCDVSLVYHSDDNTLKCHYCGKKYKMLGRCPVCKNEFLRQGKIGTQQVVDYLNKVFPDVKILRMDADTTHNKEGHGKILEAFARREAQILVGTQMIAKGHDFPLVTLVGILDADQSLYYSDYAGAEKTFELLTQVAGRSGRDTQSGKVVLQTHTPTHYCLQLAAKQDYLSFYKKEINLREASKFPPFAIITRILYSGEDSDKCIALINKHYSAIEEIRSANADKFIFLQRMRCPIKRVEKKFRFQILMRLTTDSDDILHQIYKVTDILDKDVSVFVEINPQNLS
ncbi:MAG: primosomal protein N', partial [Clostridia bacterium]